METRSAKRRRKAVDAHEALASHRCSYLDTLPLDALNDILRYLSTRPNLKRWQAYVRPADALLALQTGGSLTCSARNAFQAIHMHFDFGEHRAVPVTGIQMERAWDGSVYCDLVMEQGPRLHELSFDLDYQPRFCDGKIFEFCTSLRSLSIGHRHSKLNLNPILTACGTYLRELHVQREEVLTGDHVQAIRKHCRSLQRLTLAHETADVPLGKLWRDIGATIRRLSIGPPRNVGDVALYCPLLDDLEVSVRARSEELLVSLGVQLRHIRFVQRDSCPRPDALARILASCRNARVHAWVTKDTASTLLVLGARLVQLRVRDAKCGDDELGDALAVCSSNVEEAHVELRKSSMPFVKRFFECTPNLQKLNLSRVFVDNKNLLCLLSRRVRTVVEFSCTTQRPLDDLMVAPFIGANVRLRKLWIANKITGATKKEAKDLVEQCAARMVRAIYGHPALAEVVVCDAHRKGVSKQIADACVSMRGRHIDIIVGDVQYMPCTLLNRKYIQY